MQATVTIKVVRDDGTTLLREEHVGNEGLWVRSQRRRLTRSEMRKDLDAKIGAALNSMLGRR